MNVQRLAWVLWPSFLTAAVFEAVFFALFDPMDLELFGEPLGGSRTAVYSIGFFLFWLFGAVSSGLTCYLQRGAGEINRSVLQARDGSSAVSATDQSGRQV